VRVELRLASIQPPCAVYLEALTEGNLDSIQSGKPRVPETVTHVSRGEQRRAPPKTASAPN
jgi:hypothetical protein